MIFVFFVLLGRHGGKAAGTPGNTKAPKRVDTGQPTLFTYEIIAEFPHDKKAYTQGLQYEELCDDTGSNCREIFWESTGLNGRSQVREVDMLTGEVLRSRDLPYEDFGEGLTRHGGRLFQLTWQSGKTWSYAVDDFQDRKKLKVGLKAYILTCLCHQAVLILPRNVRQIVDAVDICSTRVKLANH
jgi:glutamine cyclotransferase